VEEERLSRIKLVADEFFNYLLSKYKEGQISVRLAEIEEHIWNKYGERLFKNRLSVNAYVSYVARHFQRYGVITLVKEIGEKGYRASLTLSYINSMFYKPSRGRQT
jgi:hypothetical protein